MKNIHIIRWLWTTSKGLRLQATINVAIGVALVLLDFSFISATKWLVDIATHRLHDDLRLAAATLIVIMALRQAIAFGNRWVVAILGVRSQNTLQQRVYTHLMHSQWDGREQYHSGDVINRLEHDVKEITNTLTETIPSLLVVGVRLLGAFIFLYTMDHMLPFLLLFISPVFVALSKIYVRRMRRLAHDIRQTDSRIQSLLQESIQHRMVLMTLERCGTMVEKLREKQRTLRNQIKHRTLFSSTSASLLGIGFSTGYLVAFLWGIVRLEQGTISYGMMLAFVQLVGQIQSPFREISRYVPALVSCLTAAERLIELEKTPTEVSGESVLFSNGAGIRLNDVSYRYRNGQRQILNRLTFDFPKGTFTAILGETGAGKTTLIRLILALLKPTEGQVTMYDEERSESVSPLTRANILYIPQGNTLMSGTIRENLLLGNPHATEVEMKEALHCACADFVFESNEGLETLCGEQGTGLSEGQAQRIAIARTLLRKGCILILDEATSALDEETEKCLMQNLHERSTAQSMTVLCITHRTSVVNYCTSTLLLERQ